MTTATEATRTSPAYGSHARAGAVFRTKNHWKRVDWFESNAARGDASRRPAGPSGTSWSAAIEAEHRATRESAGLYDLTSFGKIDVSGPGAQELLEATCANAVSRGAGALTYTQMLNVNGGVVSDVTVGQLDPLSFFVVTGTSALGHDLAWLRSIAVTRGLGTSVGVQDVTSAWACFGLWGPAAREILDPVAGASLQTDAFPYMRLRETTLFDVPVRMSRVTFVGELGWEVYVPTEYGRWLWPRLSAAVESVGGLRCGYRAIDSLRAEKGYLYLGSELTSDRTPYASGLGAFVRLTKDFVGRDALARAAAPDERLVCVTLDGSWTALEGGETVTLPDGRTGQITSGGLGYTLGSSIGFCFLPADTVLGTNVGVDVDGTRLSATVVAQPLYDPAGARIRA